MFCSIGEEGQALINILIILVPASLYIMGLLQVKKGYYFFVAGIFSHVLSIILRGLSLGRIPLSEKHDNISFMALSLALIYLYIYRKKIISNLDIAALPLVSFFTVVSAVYLPINTVSPFLKTPWFYIHTFLYFGSYGFFGISACIGIFYLLNGKSEYESIQYRTAIYGWIIFSVSLVAGSIWFFTAYGTYWLWTSKELWTALTWFYYGLYLHARLINGLNGRPAAVLGCIGFLVALFSYFGMGTIIPSPPTQF